jgi:hypothetical protein
MSGTELAFVLGGWIISVTVLLIGSLLLRSLG